MSPEYAPPVFSNRDAVTPITCALAGRRKIRFVNEYASAGMWRLLMNHHGVLELDMAMLKEIGRPNAYGSRCTA